MNRCVIVSDNIAGSLAGLPRAVATITDHGTTQGDWAHLGRLGADQFDNRGDLLCLVSLYEGKDLFDKRKGRVEGGTGNDLFLPGTEAETFIGDSGVGTLNFQGSGGLRVSPVDDEGTGCADGDTYTGFERIVGSRLEADILIGDGLANTLNGSGSNGRLQGGGGADRLEGGTEADQLSGGTGNGWFLFLAPGQRSDLALLSPTSPATTPLRGHLCGLRRPGQGHPRRLAIGHPDGRRPRAGRRRPLHLPRGHRDAPVGRDGKRGEAAQLQAGAVVVSRDIVLI